MELDGVFTVLWALWFLAFAVFEGWAVLNKTGGDTLSEHVREYFHVKGKTGSMVFLGMLGFGAAWFAAHIVQIPV